MFYRKVTKISLVLKLLVCRSLFKITQFTQNLINIKYQNNVGCNHPIIADFFSANLFNEIFKDFIVKEYGSMYKTKIQVLSIKNILVNAFSANIMSVNWIFLAHNVCSGFFDSTLRIIIINKHSLFCCETKDKLCSILMK